MSVNAVADIKPEDIDIPSPPTQAMPDHDVELAGLFDELNRNMDIHELRMVHSEISRVLNTRTETTKAYHKAMRAWHLSRADYHEILEKDAARKEDPDKVEREMKVASVKARAKKRDNVLVSRRIVPNRKACDAKRINYDVKKVEKEMKKQELKARQERRSEIRADLVRNGRKLGRIPYNINNNIPGNDTI